MTSLFERPRLVFQELRRRKVVRAGIIYVTVSGGVLAVLDNFSRLFPSIETVFPYLLIGSVLLFPVILVLAWAFEISSGALRLTSMGDQEPSVATRVGAVVVVALVSVSFGVAATRLGLYSGGEVESVAMVAPLTTMAVLPLDDFSLDGSLTNVANTLTEFLTTKLAQVEGLDVKSRVEMGSVLERGPSVTATLREMGVGSWVEGSVTGSLDQFVVTIQLIDSSTGDHIWANDFPGQQASFFPLLDSLIVAITHGLRQNLGVEVQERAARADVKNDEAWSYYSMARQAEDAGLAISSLNQTEALAQWERADSLLAQAEALDPAWADPVIERGWIQILMGRAQAERKGTVPVQYAENAARHAVEALGRMPEDPQALELRGVATFHLAEEASEHAERLYAEAERDLREAIRLDPLLARAWEALSRIEWAHGDFASARASAERALEKDQFLVDRAGILHQLVQINIDLKAFADAERWCAQGRREEPGSPDFMICHLFIVTNLADPPVTPETSRIVYDSLRMGLGEADWPSAKPWADMWMAILFARLSQPDSALARLSQARGPSGEIVDAYEEARVMYALGDVKRALDLLEIHLTESQPARKAYVREDWWFEGLQDNERFRELTSDQP